MSQTMPLVPLTFSGVALLVGVETYDGFPAEKQLLAGRNDVLAFWKVCRRLGFQPQNIRVLTSPKIEVQDLIWAEQELGPELYRGKTEGDIEKEVKAWFADANEKPLVFIDEATQKNLIEGAQWLAVRRNPGSESPATRLFTYSGHGAQKGSDLALCPQDVGGGLEQAVTFGMLRDVFAPVGENLTVVLDCCFAQRSDPPSAAHRVSTLTEGAAPQEPGREQPDFGGRVLCASARDQQSNQAMLGGYWYGAFSWALTVALEQWTTVKEGNWKRSTISYRELISRASKLLEALSFPQRPVLVHEDQIGDLPAFHHGSSPHESETNEQPDAERRGIQLDPSLRYALYTFTDISEPANHQLLAEVIAIGNRDWNGLSANTEYWKINASKTNGQTLDTRSATTIRVMKTVPQTLPFTANDADFFCTGIAAWQQNTVVSGTYHITGSDGFYMRLTYSDAGGWEGTINWVRANGATGNLFTGDISAPFDLSRTDVNGSLRSHYVTDVRIISNNDNFVLRGANGNCVTEQYASGSGTSYVRWDGNSAMPHHFIVTAGSGAISAGATVYICSTETALGKYTQVNAQGGTRLWYVSNKGSEERWIIRRVTSGAGPIRTGEPIKLESEARSGNFLSQESGGPLGIRSATDTGSLGIIWTAERT